MLPTSEPSLTSVHRGTKAGVGEDYNEPENLITPGEAVERVQSNGNYGFAAGVEVLGGRLVVLDVEEEGVLSSEGADLVDEHALVRWRSPHGGLNRLLAGTDAAYELLDGLKTSIDLDGDGDHEVELLTNGHAIGPGSRIDHSECNEGKDGCPGDGIGTYDLDGTNDEAPVLDRDDAERLRDLLGAERSVTSGGDTGGSSVESLPLPDPSEELADEGEEALRTLQKTSASSFDVLVDLLQGGTGCHEDLLRGEHGIDRSLQELIGLTRLCETVRFEGGVTDKKRVKAITLATFERYVRNHRKTRDGQLRRWLIEKNRDQGYHEDRLDRAMKACDRGKHERFLQLDPVEDERERWDGTYSRVTREVARFAVDLLTGEIPLDPEDPDLDSIREWAALTHGLDLDRDALADLLQDPPHSGQGTTPNSTGCVPADYPEQNEVVTACQRLDPTRDEDTHEEALRRNRRDGLVKQARVGQRYVVYPEHLPDPDDALWVRHNGEKYEPAPREKELTGTLVTDGGVVESDETDVGHGYTDEELRERFEHVVLTTNPKSGKRVHVSDDGGPLCDAPLNGAEWIEKPLEVYPPKWHEWCVACLDRLRDRDIHSRDAEEIEWGQGKSR
jgi:hypothetical protein